MKRTSPGKWIAGAMIVGAIAALAPLPALADPYSGWGVYGPVNGVTWANRAGFYTTSTSVTTDVRKSNSTSFPAGWAGAQASASQNSNGAVCFSSTWTYNAAATTTHTRTAAPTTCSLGQYLYSRGATQAYTGSGYSTYLTFQSPVKFR